MERAAEIEEHWGTKFAFILASIGAAIGTGNIWRFPRLLAMYGGGAFLIPYIIALITVGIPLLIGESLIGRGTGKGTILAFATHAGKKYAWMGGWIVAVDICITFYYAVVCGWALGYFVKGLTGLYGAYTVGMGIKTWESFSSSTQPMILTILIWIFTAVVVSKGAKGIGRVSTVLVPVLFVILIILAVRVLTLPGAKQGVSYMFGVKKSDVLNPNTWLQAYSQVLWSLGAGWGEYLTLSTYLRKNEDITRNAHITGFSDLAAALLASLAIIPVVAIMAPSLSVDPHTIYAEGNTGLAFVWLTEIFPLIPGGAIIGTLFFLALFFAAFTSQIIQMNTLIKNVTDLGASRKKAAIYCSIFGILCGVPAALNINWLNNQDWVWGLGLLISSLMFSFVLWKTGLEKNREIANSGSRMRIGKWWDIFVGYVSPVSITIVLLWWLEQSIVDYPTTWWKITEVSNAGTAIFQFVIVFIISYIVVNKILMPRINKNLVANGRGPN